MKIAVLTSGGVAPGMTAAVRAAAQAAFARGWEAVVVEEGYFGLLEGRASAPWTAASCGATSSRVAPH